MFQDGVKALVEKGYKKITPFFIPYAITNMGGCHHGSNGLSKRRWLSKAAAGHYVTRRH